MRSNVLVYLSGPITATPTHSVADNVASALTVWIDCTRRGIPSFCPQLGAAFPEAFTINYETWMAYDFAVIDHCTALLMLPRWGTSAGAKREATYAALKGLCVFYDVDALVRHLDKGGVN
jgi:hypothetical protein